MKFGKRRLYMPVHFILILALSSSFKLNSQDAGDKAIESSYLEAYSLYIRDNLDDRDPAIRLFKMAASEFEKSGDYIHYSDCLNKCAILYTKQRNHNEAATVLGKAEAILKEYVQEDDSLYSDFYFAKASWLWEPNKSIEAIPNYHKAIDIRINLGISDNTLSFIYNNLGRAYHHFQDFSRAADCFKNSFELKEKNLSPDDPKLGSSYINYGSTLTDLGRYNEAIEYIQKGANLYDPDDKTYGPGKGGAYNNLGLIYEKQADYQKALDHYQSALRILEKFEQDLMSWVGRIHNNIGLVYMKINEFNDAQKWLFSSLEIKILTGSVDLPSTYSNIAETYRQLGNTTEATKYYLNAIQHSIEVKGEDNVGLAIYYLNYGMFLINEFNDFDSGMKYYRQALTLCINNFGNKHPRTSLAYYNIGKYYHKINNLDSALLYIQKSISSLVPDFEDLDYMENPDIINVSSYVHLLNSIKGKAEITENKFYRDRNLSDLYLSFATFEIANKIIEEIRMGVQTEDSRMILAQNEYNTYHTIIQLALNIFELSEDPFYKNKAFEYSEKSKSANLLAALRNSEAKEIGGIPDSLIRKEQEIMSELNSYNLNVYEERGKENPRVEAIRIWEDYIFSLQNQLDSLIYFLEETYPEYYALKFKTDVVNHTDIAETLKQDEILIEYVVLDSVLFSFFHSNKKFIVHQSPIEPLFHFNARFLREILTSRNFSQGVKLDYTQFVHASNYLYEKLIEPFETVIEGCKLIIIPDETLAYIPFEVLIRDLPEYQELDYKRLSYLLLDHSISYSNSATLLVNSKKRDVGSNRRLLAFAPRYQPGKGSEVNSTLRDSLFNSLYPIPHVLEEVTYIRDLIGGDIYLDTEATEQNFKAFSSDYGILHFAMHTVINDTNPMYSKMVFTNSPQDGEDGFLNTFEIYNLSLNARMAVLSSCNSGTGQIQRGEGVMSLARGFIYAGCPSIIMTLWEVEDNSGSAIMSGFYSYLKKGFSKSDALRYAKLDFLENASMKFSHPYFWSGYVNFGNSNPIFPKSYLRIIGLILIVSLAVIAVRVGYTRLRRTRN